MIGILSSFRWWFSFLWKKFRNGHFTQTDTHVKSFHISRVLKLALNLRRVSLFNKLKLDRSTRLETRFISGPCLCKCPDSITYQVLSDELQAWLSFQLIRQPLSPGDPILIKNWPLRLFTNFTSHLTEFSNCVEEHVSNVLS